MSSTTADQAAGLAARAAAVIPGGVNSGQRQVPGLEDLIIAGTSGSTFTDASGRVYTDYHAAFGPPLLGHNDPDVDAAVSRGRPHGRPDGDRRHAGRDRAGRAARRECAVAREGAPRRATGSEATFHALRVARTATGRRHVIKFQGCYHGWHDSVAMNVISPAERVGSKDPLSDGMLPEVIDATIVCPFNDAAAVERALDEHDGDVAAIILEPIPHNIGAVLPQPGFLERLRELATKHGTVLVFDEVITGFRHGLGGYQAVAGVTPDLTTLGKAMANGWPVSALGGKAELMDLFSTTPGQPAFFAGTFNGHPATSAAALATIDKLEREPVHEHVFRLGERARTGLQALYDRIGVPAVVSGFGSVFVSYFLEGPVVSYDDLLRNDVDLFVGYRRELMKDGIFELPLNLKRSHFSYAHTDEDVDRLLEATEGAVTRHLETRGMSDSAVSCSIDLTAPGKQRRAPRLPEDHEHGRLGEHRTSTSPRSRTATGRRCSCSAGTTATSTRARSRRCACCRSCSPSRSSGRVIIIPVLSPAASKANTRNWPSGANFNRSFPGRPDGPPNEQLADYLTRVLFPLADVVIDMHSGGRSGLVHPVLAHARRRRPRAAQGDARGHGGLEQRLPLPLHRRQRHRPPARRGREPGQDRDHDRARRRRPRPGARATGSPGAGSTTSCATSACSRARYRRVRRSACRRR